MPRRHSNDPRRHILAEGSLSAADSKRLLRDTRYRGSGLHKRNPGDYPFEEPCTPRQNKTLCDAKRPMKFREASRLFAEGIRRGMVSRRTRDGFPVFVWAVDGEREVYEAKPGDDPSVYHGYPLGPRDGVFPESVRREWRRREKQ